MVLDGICEPAISGRSTRGVRFRGGVEQTCRVNELPEGWTIERVRVLAQGDAELLPVDTPIRHDGLGATRTLSPTVVVGFSGLCLVQDAQDGEWCMGDLVDGAIVCWARYGNDLEFAIRSL